MKISKWVRVSGLPVFFVFALFALFCGPALAADAKLAGQTVPMDQDKDGKIDRWVTYNSKGVRVLVAADTNGDGVPDSWSHPIRGLMILREKDRNGDGRVDDRMVTDLIYDNTLKFSRHLPLWRESDDDFDGVIDVYRVRGEKVPSPDRRGQRIDPTHWTEAKEAAVAAQNAQQAASKTPVSEQVRQMNARQDLAS